MNDMDTSRTLRLLFPQWQGGNNPPYVLGAHLLNWLAPNSNGPFEEVPVDLNPNIEKEQDIIARSTLLQQARSAKRLIRKHKPERIVVLGGDCSVELAPFSYLNEKYDGDVVLLWVDAHPDVSIPEDFENHHAHVLANLLGVGDQEFVAEIPRLFNPEQVLYVGLNDMMDALSSEPMKYMKLDIVGPDEIKQDSSKVLQLLAEKKPSKIIIHFDLDVLNMKEFRSLLVAYPGTYEEYTKSFPQGSSMETIIRVLQDVAKSYDVVGLGITEHFPWDSYFLKNMLSRLPLIGDINNKERPAFNTL